MSTFDFYNANDLLEKESNEISDHVIGAFAVKFFRNNPKLACTPYYIAQQIALHFNCGHARFFVRRVTDFLVECTRLSSEEIIYLNHGHEVHSAYYASSAYRSTASPVAAPRASEKRAPVKRISDGVRPSSRRAK